MNVAIHKQDNVCQISKIFFSEMMLLHCMQDEIERYRLQIEIHDHLEPNPAAWLRGVTTDLQPKLSISFSLVQQWSLVLLNLDKVIMKARCIHINMNLIFQLESEYSTSPDLIQALIDCKVSQIFRLTNKDTVQRLAKSYQFMDSEN